MSKVILKVEIEEEAYKQIKGDSVCSNNNECIISKSSSAYYALNAIINATPLTESDDCVSRSAVLEHSYDRYDYTTDDPIEVVDVDEIKELPSVLPKREHGEWIINEEDESVKCPSCGGEFYTWGISTERIKKCPNCGAKMEGGAE